jgi:hypothetical protein
MTLFKKAILGTALAATTLAVASPADARGYYGHYGRYHGGNGAAIGIGAGILGLAVGAAIASDHHRYRDRDYYYQPDGYYYRDGYYWDRDGRRYERDEWRRYRDGYERGFANGYDRGDQRRGYYGDDYYRRGY